MIQIVFEQAATAMERPVTNDRPLLVHHVAKIIGRSCRQVRHLALYGDLEGFKLGRKIWGFHRAAVDAYLASRGARYAYQ